MAQRLLGEGVMSLVRVVSLTSLLVAVVASFGSPAGTFKSGGWEGQANNDEADKFRDCTMTADFENGIRSFSSSAAISRGGSPSSTISGI
jgi:hypothetical protein